MKRITSIILSIVILITATVSVSAAVSFGHNHTYTDISTDDWFYEDIKWVVENYLSENDLMSGGDPRPFRPNELLTRCDAVLFFYSVMLCPDVETVSDGAAWRSEVAGKYYEKAVTWAYSADIIDGFPDGTFRPNELVTREQLSKMVARFAAYHEVYKKTETDLSKFTDGAKVAKWAREDVEFSVGNGIIIGRTVKKLDPKGTATRAECCTMIRRFVETFGIEK